MSFELDASEFENEDDAHGGDRPKPGQYHVEVTEIDDTFEKLDKIIVRFRVLAGTVPGQEGKEHLEFFPTSDAAMPRLNLFGLVTGLIAPGEKKEVQLTDAVGRQLVIGLVEKEGKGEHAGQVFTNMGWDSMWSLQHDAIKDVPKSEEALAALNLDGQPADVPSPSPPPLPPVEDAGTGASEFDAL